MCLHSAYEAGGVVYARDLATAVLAIGPTSSTAPASTEPKGTEHG